MENTLTAVEWLVQILELSNPSKQYQAEIEQAKKMEEEQKIKFAKLHVEAALKEVSEKKTDGMLVVPLFNEYQIDTILNTYPLDKIK